MDSVDKGINTLQEAFSFDNNSFDVNFFLGLISIYTDNLQKSDLYLKNALKIVNKNQSTYAKIANKAYVIYFLEGKDSALKFLTDNNATGKFTFFIEIMNGENRLKILSELLNMQ
jgi:hypothetical protein